MTNIIDSANIVSDDGLRMVKITSMRNAPAGVPFYVKIHDEGVIRPVNGVARFTTAEPLKLWGATDHVSVDVAGRGTVLFMCHTMGGPKYPVARLNGKTGKPRNVRVTFYTERDAVISKTENKMAAPPTIGTEIIDTEFEEVNENVQMVLMLTAHVSDAKTSVDEMPVKPIKDDFANFGEYMKACKKHKAAMCEWEARNVVTA